MSVNPYPISFQVRIQPLDPKIPSPEGISFDVPCTEQFNQVQEGFVSLGIVPNSGALDSTVLKPNKETTMIKSAGSPEILLPENLLPLMPFVSLVASYEATHSKGFIDKEAVIIVKEERYTEYTGAGIFHRDPPNMQRGGIQNAYSFASTQPTNFTHDRTPEPYEVSCFTPGAVHWRPDIYVPAGQDELRRLFVLIAFDYKPELGPDELPHRVNWFVNRRQIQGQTL